MKSLLVPTDFSPCSNRALNMAIQFASSAQAELHLLHIVSNSLNADQRDLQTRTAREQINAALQSRDELNLKTHKAVQVGVAHRAIVQYARDNKIDLIVMGTHGRTGLAQLALGSVAERVLRSSPCPITVLRESEEAPEMQLEREPTASQPPALDLVRRAQSLNATDIHLDPTETGGQVRFRIDGILHDYCELDSDVAEHLRNQFKTIANVDIADPFVPKEGRLQLPRTLEDVEVRLTCAPVAGGEAMALRISSRDNVYRPLDELGLHDQAREAIHSMLRSGEGLTMITGPTGSGKTTTIYAMLRALGGKERNIVSIEDPVEYAVPFVRQMNVDPRHGIDMAFGLRTLLRMDPDVIFVGEARDTSAAEITMRAASSGRYVLSTLHTRDIAATVTALRDLGIRNRSIAANLNGIVNQRLVRRLCLECRREVPVSEAFRKCLEEFGLEVPDQIFERVGCDVCRNTGYFGRVGVFEAVEVNDSVAAAIGDHASEQELRRLLQESGLRPLRASALEAVSTGITDELEADRVHWLQ